MQSERENLTTAKYIINIITEVGMNIEFNVELISFCQDFSNHV